MKMKKKGEVVEDNFKEDTTKNGDTWDSISYILFSNSKAIDYLFFWNKQYSDYAIFPAGITLKYKNIKLTDEDIPPWRR